MGVKLCVNTNTICPGVEALHADLKIKEDSVMCSGSLSAKGKFNLVNVSKKMNSKVYTRTLETHILALGGFEE